MVYLWRIFENAGRLLLDVHVQIYLHVNVEKLSKELVHLLLAHLQLIVLLSQITVFLSLSPDNLSQLFNFFILPQIRQLTWGSNSLCPVRVKWLTWGFKGLSDLHSGYYSLLVFRFCLPVFVQRLVGFKSIMSFRWFWFFPDVVQKIVVIKFKSINGLCFDLIFAFHFGSYLFFVLNVFLLNICSLSFQ